MSSWKHALLYGDVVRLVDANGFLLCEIQANSDGTYDLYRDYDEETTPLSAKQVEKQLHAWGFNPYYGWRVPGIPEERTQDYA